MRVLAMFHAYVPTHGAGAETMAHAMLRHLVQHGHQVDVILSQVDPTVPYDYTFEGVNVHVHQGKTQTPSWINGGMRPHVIVCHLENTPRAAVLGKMYEIPVVQLLHNHRPETMASVIQHHFGLLVCNTRWLGQEYADHWADVGNGRPSPRTIVIRPPVDPKEYGGRAGTHVTLVNLTVAKGAHVFYALAERMPNLKFLGVKGAYGIQVVRNDLPNVEVIEHVGSDEMVKKVYARSKVVLMPSDYESYGRVAVEAACSGIPVIAHPTEGLKEALGVAGIFCDRDHLAAWEAELRRLHTPRGWSLSSKAMLSHAKTLDPADELELWRTTLEEVASAPAHPRHR